MKKINKIDSRGFVIVETIVVAVFIIGICTFLFANFLPLIGDYERVSNYDDLDSKYKTHEIRKMILREIANDNSKKTIFSSRLSSSSFYYSYSSYNVNNGEEIIKKYEICDELNNPNYCNKLLGESFLNVKEIIVTPFKLSSSKQEIKNDTNVSRAVKEYIEYLPSYSKYSSKYDSYYRIIVVFNNGNIANIEVNYE